MDDDAIRSLLLAWRSREYDLASDLPIEALEGRSFGVEEVVVVLRWKLARLWPRKAESNFRAGNDDSFVRATTRQAFESDPADALGIVCSIKGIGPVVGSALLMAHDPHRFTVMDWRALASLRALALLPGGPARPSAPGWLRTWPAYLQASTHLAQRTGLSLREVDQGLWAAQGRTSLPLG